jgi:hypothetical protein
MDAVPAVHAVGKSVLRRLTCSAIALSVAPDTVVDVVVGTGGGVKVVVDCDGGADD